MGIDEVKLSDKIVDNYHLDIDKYGFSEVWEKYLFIIKNDSQKFINRYFPLEFIGFMYENGYGVERDVEKTIEWYTHAANNGNSDAMYNLAVIYQYGIDDQGDENKDQDSETRGSAAYQNYLLLGGSESEESFKRMCEKLTDDGPFH